MAVKNIRYEEGTNTGYKYVEISYGDGEVKKFDSGDFVKDWFACMKFIIFSDISTNEPIINSSSIDHFIMDGAPYDSAYLIPAEGNTQLSYEYQEDRLEFFVPRGTKPTWEEMKVKYDDEYKKS